MGNKVTTQKTVSNKRGVVKQTGIRLPEDLYKALKINALNSGVGVSVLAEQAIRNYLSKEAKRAA